MVPNPFPKILSIPLKTAAVTATPAPKSIFGSGAGAGVGAGADVGAGVFFCLYHLPSGLYS